MASSEIPVLGPVINKMFGSRNVRVVKKLTDRVSGIGDLEPEMRRLTDAQLRAKTQEFRDRVSAGASLDSIIVEVFAVAREVMDRAVGIRNAFNPRFADQFPVDRLPVGVRETYEKLKAEMDGTEARAPQDDLLGFAEAVPAWVWMDIPNEVYDAVRELFPESRPPFRARPFDVQLIGGITLYNGKIAEMKTGEGKTIVAPLACYLACCDNLLCHVVTVNDYLVQRDRDWVAPFYHALGLTVGAIHPQHMQGEDVKRDMYLCDVVYGTTSEFGFDYLRDNMKRAAEQQVQRAREFAIVDEVDSTLIDEARTPLIISGQAHEGEPRYDLGEDLARHLVRLNKPWDEAEARVEKCKMNIKGTEGDIRNARDKSAVPALSEKLEKYRAELIELEESRDRHARYYEVEKDKKQVTLTHHGVQEAQKKADVGSFYVGANIDVPHLLEQALRAHAVYERDVDYVVMATPDPMTGQSEPDIVIVDVNTGRPMVGRQWSDGLHQAIQQKEGLKVRPETQTVATITIQNFFKMYDRLAGMTGTADTEAQEFNDIYKLDVVVIPTNVPVTRRDYDDTVYLTAKDKWGAIVEEIKLFHDVGRPVLVGTTSVEKSETLSKMLTQKHAIKHEVLNAKQHEREAGMIESAGTLGAVMIATNMAGRGTDIKLAKVSREDLLAHWQRRNLAPRDLKVDASDEEVREKVYRKIAPNHLDGVSKRDAESMSFGELELALLRKWAVEYAWVDEKKAGGYGAEELRNLLDEQGRFALHRIGWRDSVESLGGLHVIGTERHESRRIDNQLRGRAGRQGDNGSSRFYVSLEDPLMQMFAGETTMKILSRMGMKEGDAIEHPMLSKSIAKAQRKVEERNFQIRKNILEYDEVMEHQRQDFYGMRQRVLDGDRVRTMLLEFISDSVGHAVDTYLSPGYRNEKIAEYAAEALGCSIPPERIRAGDREDLEKQLRREAVAEAGHEVDLTLGEYIPEGAAIEDMDVKGLVGWGESRFGVQITASDVAEKPTGEIAEMLRAGARVQVDEADLSGLDPYMVADLGARDLVAWVERTTGLKVSVEEVSDPELTTEGVVDRIMERVQEAFERREVEHPVNFVMQMTMSMMQHDAKAAGASLVNWANLRYELGWDESVLRTKMPQQLRDELMRASAEFTKSDRIEREVAEALAIEDPDAQQAHLRERLGVELTPRNHRLRGEKRAIAVRSRIESVLRAEMVQLERLVLLETLDPAWKDHLYQMDQLKDAIGFRAFSQQDPRIEYKREGSRLYTEMLDRLRDRAAEFVFRAQVTPQLPAGARPAPRPQQPAPQQQQQPAQQQAGGQPAAAPQQAPAARRPAGALGRLAGSAGGAMPLGGGLGGPGLPGGENPSSGPASKKDDKD